jgi:hypothetical protein
MTDRGRQAILRNLQRAVGRSTSRGNSARERRDSRPEDFASIGIPVVYVNADGSERTNA